MVMTVFDERDRITDDGLEVLIDHDERLTIRIHHGDGDRVVALSGDGAARKLARALCEALDIECEPERTGALSESPTHPNHRPRRRGW